MKDTVKINDRFTVARFAPDAEQIRHAAQEGFRSLINMQTDEEKNLKMMPRKEAQIVEEEEMNYLHYPVDNDKLSDEVVDAFRRKTTQLPAPVFVHCASGKRSAALVMMEIACEQGMSGEEAVEKAEEMGFEIDTPEMQKFVKNYVNNHNSQD